MANVKSAQETAAKWSSVTPQRSQYYEDGVKNPRSDWATAAAAAEGNWNSAITKAAAEKRYGKGVNKAGTAKWQKAAVEKGVSRFQSGVQAGADAYAAGIQPVLDVIQRTNIGPRYMTGDPRNIERVAKLSKALHAMKTG